jgi:hypothetical protein
MRVTSLAVFLIFSHALCIAQNINLTDYLLAPRLDTIYWQKDFEILSSSHSPIANRCETCIYNETDSTRGRFCFNTSSGQIQLDTVLHNFDQTKLVGQWKVLGFGLFEITDSIPLGANTYYRTQKIVKEQKDAAGSISFTARRIKPALQNIGEIPNVNKRYKIQDGKFLTTRTSSVFCGATIIGLTRDGVLILDDHTYRTLGKRGRYFTMKTSIRRLMLKKISLPGTE